MIQTGSVWYILDQKSEKEKYLNEKGISIKKEKIGARDQELRVENILIVHVYLICNSFIGVPF